MTRFQRKPVIGFTGTRTGLTFPQKRCLAAILKDESPVEVVHGGAIGADAEFHRICCSMSPSIFIRILPCDIEDQRALFLEDELLGCLVAEPIGPLVRNRDIVLMADRMLACPAGESEELRSGTWSTIRYAKKRKKRITIIWPHGTEDEW